jgi:hypothetical protein
MTMNRRRFLAQSAAFTGLALASPNLLLRGQNAATKRLNIAMIGAAGKGRSDRSSVAKDHNIVALVDVDSDRLAIGMKSAKETNPGGKPAQGFQDFRKMFDLNCQSMDFRMDSILSPAALRSAASLASLAALGATSSKAGV